MEELVGGRSRLELEFVDAPQRHRRRQYFPGLPVHRGVYEQDAFGEGAHLANPGEELHAAHPFHPQGREDHGHVLAGLEAP
jgi:hypothetical protein